MQLRERLHALLELFRTVLGGKDLAEQPLCPEHHDREQSQRAAADPLVGVDHRDCERGSHEIPAEHRCERARRLFPQRAVVEIAAVSGNDKEVDTEREKEDRDDECEVDRVVGRRAQSFAAGVEADAAQQREPGVGDQVVDEEVAAFAEAKVADDDRRNTDERRGGPAEQDHRHDKCEEAARHEQPAAVAHACACVDRPQIGHDREAEQGGEQGEIPTRIAGNPDGQSGRCCQQRREGEVGVAAWNRHREGGPHDAVIGRRRAQLKHARATARGLAPAVTHNGLLSL